MTERWWQDPQRLQEEVRKHGTLVAVSNAHGGTPAAGTLSKWWVKLRLPALPVGRPSQEPAIRTDGTQKNAILLVLKKNADMTVHELSDSLDVSPRVVRDILEELREEGHVFDLREERISLRTLPLPTDSSHALSFDGEVYRFGVATDTHLGSKHCRLDGIHAAYDKFQEEGISEVYHSGDLVCGIGIYRGQVNDIALHSYQAQVDYAVAAYPQRDGITTHIIGGNHDLEGEFGKVGANPVLGVCNRREDMLYGGDFRATYVTHAGEGASIYLIHPKGGKSYAISYKPQKMAESFLGGAKPDIALMGHYHDAGFFWARGVAILMGGCFEAGGSLGYRMFLGEPALGFWIVEATIDEGIRSLYPRWFPLESQKEG